MKSHKITIPLLKIIEFSTCMRGSKDVNMRSMCLTTSDTTTKDGAVRGGLFKWYFPLTTHGKICSNHKAK